MGFVLHLQHPWSENRGAVTSNANTDYRPKEMRCGEGMSSKQPFLALQTENTAYVVFITLPFWQKGILLLICTRSGAHFPLYQLPGLFACFPPSSSLPSATCYTRVTHTNAHGFLSGQRNRNHRLSKLFQPA